MSELALGVREQKKRSWEASRAGVSVRQGYHGEESPEEKKINIKDKWNQFPDFVALGTYSTINRERGLCSVGSTGDAGLHGLRCLIVSFNTTDLIIEELYYILNRWVQWGFSRATKALRQWETRTYKNLNIFQYFEIKILILRSRKCIGKVTGRKTWREK